MHASLLFLAEDSQRHSSTSIRRTINSWNPLNLNKDGKMDETPMTVAVRNRDLSEIRKLEAQHYAMSDAHRLLAAAGGDLDILKHILSHDQVHPRTAEIAALVGNWAALEFAINHGSCALDQALWTKASWHESPFFATELQVEGISEYYAAANALEIYDYLLTAGCPWSSKVVHQAIVHQTVHFLRFALQHGCSFDFTAIEAAITGEASAVRSTLTLLRSHGAPWPSEWLRDALSLAFDVDNQEAVAFLLSLGATWPADLVKSIAADDALKAIEGMLEMVMFQPAVTFEDVDRPALKALQPTLKSFVRHGRADILMRILPRRRQESGESLVKLVKLAVRQRQHACLQVLLRKGAHVNRDVIAQAVATADVAMLTTLRWHSEVTGRNNLWPNNWARKCAERAIRAQDRPLLGYCYSLQQAGVLAFASELYDLAVSQDDAVAIECLLVAGCAPPPGLALCVAKQGGPRVTTLLFQLRPSMFDLALSKAAASAGNQHYLQNAVPLLRLVLTTEHAYLPAGGGHLECLEALHALGCPLNATACARAAKGGHLECLIFLHEHGCPWDEDTTHLAKINNHQDCLSYAIENGCPERVATLTAAAEGGSLNEVRRLYGDGRRLSPEEKRQVAIAAAKGGSVQCMRFLREKLRRGSVFVKLKLLNVAAAAGKLDMLKYLHKLGFACDAQTVTLAASAGSVPCIEFLRSLPKKPVPWDAATCAAAAQAGSLEVLRHLHEHGCPWTASTCEEAARHGHLACLTYAHKHGCEWNESVCAAAAGTGQMNCLVYLVQEECPFDASAHAAAVAGGHHECERYISEVYCLDPVHPDDFKDLWSATTPAEVNVRAARGDVGFLAAVRAYVSFAFFTAATVALAAAAGSIECLKVLVGMQCPMDSTATKLAAEGGHLECLKYLHQQGCEWDEATVVAARENGELDCLNYALDNGCPDPGEAGLIEAALRADLWALEDGFKLRHVRPSDAIMEAASASGSILCLERILRQRGSEEVNDKCGIAAASAGQEEMLKHLGGRGCKFTKQTYAAAAAGGHMACLEFLYSVKCPRDATALVAAVRATASVVCVELLIAHGCRFTVDALAQATEGDNGAYLGLLISEGCNLGGPPVAVVTGGPPPRRFCPLRRGYVAPLHDS